MLKSISSFVAFVFKSKNIENVIDLHLRLVTSLRPLMTK
jgi:hypothetical protein